MTTTKDTDEKEPKCPVPDCSGNRWEAALLETNRVLVVEMGKTHSLQEDHKKLQELNLEALQEQSKHNVFIEQFLRDADKQEKINDEIFGRLRELSRDKVETVDFRLAVAEIKEQTKGSIDVLRTDGKWFIGISLSAATIFLSLVVVLMNILGK